MKTNVVEKSQWGRELEVEIEAGRIEKEPHRAYRNYQKRVEIPGFRKGKVPLRLIVSRYGASIRSEVISDMLPTFLEEATRDAGLVPAAPPQISKIDHEPGSELTFTATLDIWP
ncbi:MAG: trigger factor family protein, partial [Candidatus Latescibacterota bacterium]|nr:trigger factor family protein [Candidatus Latescibacterota bacterium]